MQKKLLTLLLLSFIFGKAESCLGQVVNDGGMGLTLCEYYDTMFYYCDTIRSGWYSSCSPMSNGEHLLIYLGPIDDEEFAGRYIEKNMWGTFSGTWSCVMYGKGDCKTHIFLDGKYEGNRQMYYDGKEKDPCWWTTMYFYSNCDTSTSHYVEIRGRTGELIPIFYAKIEDANHNQLLYHNQYAPPIERCTIPLGAKYIYVSGEEPGKARGFCEYLPDSGDVTFVVLPTANDYSFTLHKDFLEYYPLNEKCKLDNLNVLKLIYLGRINPLE